MENEIFEALIIDDHPLIAEAYRTALTTFFDDRKRVIAHIFHDIDSVLEKFQEKSFFHKLDVVFLDISLPPSKNGKVLSGEDLGIEIKRRFPNIKIVIATTFNNNYRIYNILKSVDPEGFLVKNDMTPKELNSAIKTLIENPPYYSSTVLQMMRKQLNEDLLLDKIDRKLLHELSIGTKMKELPEVLNLSTGGVERRKRNLKIVFEVEGKGDRALMKIAREKGFI